MLVLQMENSFEESTYYSIDFFRRKDHFLVVFQYQGYFNAYVIYFTKHDQIMQLSEDELRGINVNVRN
jgi:hypothetical protein